MATAVGSVEASSQVDGLRPFANALAAFDPIALSLMAGVALLRRTDTKYVLATSHALAALDCLREDYWALEVAGTRLHRYRTQYFDTPSLTLYLRHHAGSAVRYKIRSRAYLDSGLAFVEVKRKDNRDWTTKHRTRTDDLLMRLTPDARAFVGDHFPLPAQELLPTIQNDYVRITLVSKRYPERLTLDLGIRYARSDSAVVLPGIVIAEVKQAGINRASEFIRVMRALSLHPSGISKYCVGVSLLYDSVKHNNFKPKLRLLERAVGGEDAWCRA